MIKLIIGSKGTGKTKQLIELVNSTADASNSDIVCIEKGNKLRFEIKYQVRLIEADESDIKTAEALYGFVAGILASNNDVKYVFIDSALKIIGEDLEGFDRILSKFDKLTASKGVELIMTSSVDVEKASDTVKKYIAD